MKSDEPKHAYLVTELKNWIDIFKLNQRFLTKYIYRGQALNAWELSTSLERQFKRWSPYLAGKDLLEAHEREVLKEFQWKYPLYALNKPDLDNIVEWLTIMQHYGTATRMLDFTYSIFVAMFVAVAENGESGAIWAINKLPLHFQVFDKYREINNVESAGNDILDQFALDQANDILLNHRFDHEIKKQLFIIKPNICNERLSRQQGLFLMPSLISCPFSECLFSYLQSSEPMEVAFNNLIDYSHGAKYRQEDISLIKIVIPKKLNYIIMKYLREMNITAELLFPGLEGLAKSLNTARFSINYEDDEPIIK
ncbi:MAG: FRG domain-containing protein [Bacteroidales bacterium]|nr:FRG domain-containing protein [Bacteroidales bacterium]